MENDDYLMILISFVLSISSVIMLAACLCCRKKVPNNELLGLEGMVKIKNPDENLLNGNHAISVDPNPKASTNDVDPKRASNAPHRSLPDIPVSDPNQLDTNSDLYATVGDKVGEKPQGRSPSSSTKKQISVSQHSSISQADDCSSPYARVRSPSHAYDKVRPAEHPYAQLKVTENGNRPSTSNGSNLPNNAIHESSNSADEGSLSRRGSHQSLLDTVDGRQHQVIPAASAIAGRVSASQELPYMTPPIVQPQQYFSGDSQDSSKGYTSISVREPLANIIAQTKKQNALVRRREMTDSHYATVSDDSDEMYAAIDDPNNQVDLYTSGSETYAQIQPQEPVTVSVEINTTPTITTNAANVVQPALSPVLPSNPSIPSQQTIMQATMISSVTSPRHSIIGIQGEEIPNPTPADILKAAHSRQASSSSCTSSVGNLGSPKPEKRQANSPLPPTPKNTHHYLSNTSLTNPNSIQSGRSSAASVIEVSSMPPTNRQISRENLSSSLDAGRSILRLIEKNGNDGNGANGTDDEPRKNRLSKDLEGMYAKVMKKNKLSNVPSQNTSPVPYRKSLHESKMDRHSVFLSDPDIACEINLPDALSKSVHASPGKNSIKSSQMPVDNNYETIDKRRARSSNSAYDSKDPGYETIPADKINIAIIDLNAKRSSLSRASAPPGIFAQKLLSQHSLNSFPEVKLAFSNNYGGDNSEPGYESLPDPSLLTNDPGYETVQPNKKTTTEKPNSDYDPNYEVLRPTNVDNISDHYAKVWNKSKLDANDGYSSIKTIKNIITNDDNNPDYCTISNNNLPNSSCDTIKTSPINHDYAFISESKERFNQFEDEDVYSSITTTEPSAIDIDYHNGSNGKSNKKLERIVSLTPSPNNLMITSTCSTISDTKTLTSPSSESGDGTSSSNTQINYNNIRSNTDLSQLTVSVTNYDSLTGSESDSNYESVRYLNAHDKENPYEQLHNESDLKYNTLKGDENSPNPSKSNGSFSSSSKSDGKISSSSSSNLNNTDNSETGEYFQV